MNAGLVKLARDFLQLQLTDLFLESLADEGCDFGGHDLKVNVVDRVPSVRAPDNKPVNAKLKLYMVGPVSVVKKQGADLLCQIHGSPFYIDGVSLKTLGAECVVPGWLVQKKTRKPSDNEKQAHNMQIIVESVPIYWNAADGAFSRNSTSTGPQCERSCARMRHDPD